MAKTLSGRSWVEKFPTSVSTDDLVEPFKSNVKKFLAALAAAGATVTIAATKRPKERAFLMHWSYRVARESYDPAKVPVMAGVDIDWVHRDDKGNKNGSVSKTNAEQMVIGYDIAYRPAVDSRHTEAKAIDMDITWITAELKIKDGAGKDVTIKTGLKNGSNTALHKVGKSYDVVKLVSDPPHWSSDGH
jgi:plastocyanin